MRLGSCFVLFFHHFIISSAVYNRIILVSVPEQDTIMFALIDSEDSNFNLERHGTLDLTGVHAPQGLAYDSKSELVYWANGSPERVIRRSSIYGGNSEIIIQNISFDVLAIEVDGPNVYWTQNNELLHFNGISSIPILQSVGAFRDMRRHGSNTLYYLTEDENRIGRLRLENFQAVEDEAFIDVYSYININGFDVAKKIEGTVSAITECALDEILSSVNTTCML
ncbi:uncharacterized protein LOC117106241 [Anneissia japonica]|uniref:uncharacterized protein LOC117106241 n=1 Tax=Anneissia japonica TaxID=1529436 RepID=UPI001425644C|nr:uncharacterized protein LOC117106241 [Anneissia japonica]